MAASPPSDVGTHCSLPACGSLDLLPIRCTACDHLYCRHHAQPSTHACPVDPERRTVEPHKDRRSRAEVDPSRRERDGPELRQLLPDPKRNKLKHGSTVNDVLDDAKRTKQEIALATLRRAIDAKKSASTTTSDHGSNPATAHSVTSPLTRTAIGSTSGSIPATRSRKTNPTLELMKLKQRAKPADPRKKDGDVPMPERIYLTVRSIEGRGRVEKGVKEVWVHKEVSAGRALDLFAILFQVANVNNTTTDPAKRLLLEVQVEPDSAIETLDLSTRFDTRVKNLSTVYLVRGASP
ncbi:hypothetical protein JCM10212_000467 [Sporobolomyces blumeae]